MPGGFSIGPSLCNPNSLFNGGGGEDMDFLSNPSTANTKTAWTQLTASTPADICWLEVFTSDFGGSSNPMSIAFDIGVGASGSEHAVISNFAYSSTTNDGGKHHFALPLQIPAGSRVSIRFQTDNISQSFPFWVTIVGYDGWFTNPEGAAGAEGIGISALTAKPYNTAFTPGNSGVYGSWAQLTASTSRDYVGLVASFDANGGAADSNFNSALADISIGASGSEQIIIKDIFWRNDQGMVTPFYPILIPAGSRLSVRGSLSGTVGTTGNFGCALLGVYL